MIHIFLVDDQEGALRLLRRDISEISYFKTEIVGQAKDKKTALREIKSLPRIDLVITDLRFQNEESSDLDGLAIIEEVKKMRKNCKVLVITGDNETDWYDIVIGQKNADGLLSKDFTVFDLASAIDTIMNKNRVYFSQKVAFLLQKRQEVRSDSKEFQISEKALQMLRLLSEGNSREQIAHHLQCSKGYVDKIFHNLFQLFGVANAAQLVNTAKTKGII